MEKYTSILKNILNKMGFKSNKIITGQEAKNKLASEQLQKAPLSDKEIQFILTKLRQAQYTGVEFELFHSIFVKLTNILKK